MNSKTRSLLFWMVLVLVVVTVWSVSSQFAAGDSLVDFSEFMRWVDTGQVDRVELTGNEIVGISTSGEPFRTYAPPQYEGLVNTLIDRNVIIQAREAAGQPMGDPAVLLGADPADHRVLGVLHAADAERRQQSAVVRQEPGQAVIEHREEGDLQGRRGRR